MNEPDCGKDRVARPCPRSGVSHRLGARVAAVLLGERAASPALPGPSPPRTRKEPDRARRFAPFVAGVAWARVPSGSPGSDWRRARQRSAPGHESDTDSADGRRDYARRYVVYDRSNTAIFMERVSQ